LLPEDQAPFGIFIPPKAASFLLRRFTPLQSTDAQSGRVETVSLEFNALALLILKAPGLALTCELQQLYLGRQMV
jgi:hypothetical protein